MRGSVWLWRCSTPEGRRGAVWNAVLAVMNAVMAVVLWTWTSWVMGIVAGLLLWLAVWSLLIGVRRRQIEEIDRLLNHLRLARRRWRWN